MPCGWEGLGGSASLVGTSESYRDAKTGSLAASLVDILHQNMWYMVKVVLKLAFAGFASCVKPQHMALEAVPLADFKVWSEGGKTWLQG